MHIDQHAETCVKKFGKPYFEVHRFLDRYEQDFRGYEHRRFLHHRMGVELVVATYGEEARAPAELHIRQDTGGELPEDWSFYGEPLLLKIEDYDEQEAEMRRLYGDDAFERLEFAASSDA